MKVVLFCGGQGMRLRQLNPDSNSMTVNVTEELPKPMVQIGAQRPLLWHVMKYYAHYGHTEFILCLGYKGEVIKNYFLNYNEYMSNNFILEKGGKSLRLLSDDIQDWKITFVDTGLYSNIGERLRAAQPYLEDDEIFLANYSDGLSDLPHDVYMEQFLATGKTAGFVCVKPQASTHIVHASEDGSVESVQNIREASIWINGGYFILRRELFDQMQPGEELVEEPFSRLIAQKKLYAHKYDGFWACIDTFKEKQALDEMNARGQTPWKIWSTKPASTPAKA